MISWRLAHRSFDRFIALKAFYRDCPGLAARFSGMFAAAQ
jgi:hypothetical protein